MGRFLTLIISWLMLTIASEVKAQVIPDQSLPNNSVVSEELEVTGGTVAGDNLLHSFSELSVNSGETVFFNNDSAIANIISRVTGNNVSTIDGLLRANGSANLFLINPNGIIFSENAALDIGGSFISSTANSIQFADGSEFSAVDPAAVPLLTVSIPVGLQYGEQSGDITISGLGNNLSIDDLTFTVDRSDRPVGLEVDRGNTLAILGGNIFLPGGNLTAAEGRVVLGSVNDGLVRLSSDALGWNFDYDQVGSFNNIDLSQAASIEVSGNSGGEVRLQGRAINLTDGAAILADTLGDGAGRVLEISATENISLLGFAADNFFPTRLSTDVDLNGTADGGNLFLDTDSLLIADGAQVNSGTFGSGNAGDLDVTALYIEVLGESNDGEFVSGLFVQSDFGQTGDGGNLTIATDFLLVGEGADISTTAFGSGNAGNLDIKANTIELEGISDIFLSGSGLSATTEGEGSGGNILIETNNLLVNGGADISTTTFGSGNAGDLNIKANTIELNEGAGEFKASGLFANVEANSLGDGGNLNIEVNNLTITGGAQITARTEGIGNAGTIKIDSQNIDLVGTSPGGAPGGIFATTQSDLGQGGNIEIYTEDLNIVDAAQIATTTLSSASGGSIEILANNSIRLQGNSESGSSGILATALLSDGAGGNLTVTADSLSLLDGATISVSNFPSNSNSPLDSGSGAAGDINVTASRIFLDGQANISADTFSGDRGNINFQTDLLILRRQSNISTNAQSTATGGNIVINAEDGFVVAFPEENSDITANAVFGDGGRVDLVALEIFGIEPRSDLTPFSDITASSEFGIAGNISFNNQDFNPTDNLTKLSNTFNPPQLTNGCNVTTNNASSFTNLGQGGLNPQPTSVLEADDLVGDVEIPKKWSQGKSSNNIQEAQSWVIGDRGNVILIAAPSRKSFSSRCS